MRKVVMIAAAALAFVSACVFVYVNVVVDKDDLDIKQKLWCWEFLGSVRSDRDRSRLVAWADAEIFSREFDKDDFRFGHFSGPRMASHTLDTRNGALRLPLWMPSHYEIRVLGRTGREFNSVFITGGRYRGLVVVRDGWDEAFDGKYLRPTMIAARRGRVGLVCFVD